MTNLTPQTLRIPITNTGDDSDYSCQLLIGSRRVPANVILDTGSSTLAVDPSLYNPALDSNAKPTDLAQWVPYDTGGWFGPVVKTSMVLGNANHNITLHHAPIAVTDFQTSDTFDGTVDGIMGLAYFALNDAYQFLHPTPSTPWPFPTGNYKNAATAPPPSRQIRKRSPPPIVDPYFNELEQHGLTMNKFAFYTLRSWVHHATNNQSAINRDPLNNGIFVLGGGEHETDLYTGRFTHDVKVFHDVYYNSNLISTQVEGCPPVKALPLQSNFESGNYSNSVIDQRHQYPRPRLRCLPGHRSFPL